MKISVCLATYNGEKYIKEQLDSILPQLSANDEIIISDDNSTDDTINIIRSLNDERIKIYVNKTKGIVKNFENALNNASGDIIFLSDQDDVWKNDKVKKILSAFSSDNSLTLVFSNAEIIDENGISKKWMQYMKNSIMSTGGKYSTARMVVDYTNQLYIPLCNLTKKYYTNLESVTEYSVWKKDITTNWKDVQIEQIEGNADNITLDAGNQIEVKCVVTLPNIDVRHIEAQVYYGKFLDDGSVQDVKIIPMKLDGKDDENKKYYY